MERMAQMVQHVIALAIDDAALEHRVVQSRFPNDLFRSPFRFVISRATARSRPQKADQGNLSRARLSRRFDHIARAINVDALIRLPAELAVDPGAMRDRIATRKCSREFIDIIQADPHETRSGKLLD